MNIYMLPCLNEGMAERLVEVLINEGLVRKGFYAYSLDDKEKVLKISTWS